MKYKPKYQKCDHCTYRVPQVIDRIIKGKRITLCINCAARAGWFDEEGENEQGRLF